MMRRPFAAIPSRSRQGSIFILVVAIVAVLVLLTLTLSYMTKVDLLAARNWGNTVQSRMAAVTGVALYQSANSSKAAVERLSGSARSGGTASAVTAAGASAQSLSRNRLEAFPLTLGLNQKTIKLPSSLNAPLRDFYLPNNNSRRAEPVSSSRQRAGLNGRPQPVAGPLASVLFEDESAKFNINALLPLAEQRGTSRQSQLSEAARLAAAAQAEGANAAAQQNLEQQQEASASRTQTTPAGANRTPGARIAEVKPAYLSEQALARFIQQVFETAGVQGNPRVLAHEIARRRWGRDNRPGLERFDDLLRQTQSRTRRSSNRQTFLNQSDEAANRARLAGLRLNEASCDPRRPALGDDYVYGSLDELMTIPGMTPAAYRALAPYLTTLSVSFAAFELPQEDASGVATAATALVGTAAAESSLADPLAFPQIDPNTAEPEQLFDVLRRRFPKAPEALIGQFVVNMLDRRDVDDVPTTLRLGAGTYYGQELVPLINEVCPDPTYSDSTEGQYIELFNPYSKALDLQGWSIQGAGAGIALTGSLPSGAYLVLTNDYNNENETADEASSEDLGGEGSFYNIFHVVPTGPLRQLREFPQMKLVKTAGVIKLVNPQGRVVDEFSYERGQAAQGLLKSYQRRDPRLRVWERLKATPLADNVGVLFDSAARRSLEILEAVQNQPFQSPLDVMLVSSAYVTKTLEGQATKDENKDEQLFALPALASGDEGLDLRLVDCFRLGAVVPSQNEVDTQLAQNQAGLSARGMYQDGRRPQFFGRSLRPEAPRCDVVYGLLNLNTAPLATLAALPGMDNDLLTRIARVRRGMFEDPADQRAQNAPVSPREREWWQSVEPFSHRRWRNLSDFLMDEEVWAGRPLYDRLDAAYPFCQLVTMHTMALRAITANRTNPEVAAAEPTATPTETPSARTPKKGSRNVREAKSQRRPTMVRAERLLAADRGVLETVSFRYLPQDARATADPDLRYAGRKKPSTDRQHRALPKITASAR